MTSPYLSSLTNGRDNNFDIIRHLAASAVLVSHAYPIALGRESRDMLGDVLDGVTLGSLAVAAFFAISGFLVTASWERFQIHSNGWRGFLKARCLRIFPGLIGAVLFTVILGALLTTSPVLIYLQGAVDYFLRTTTLISISQRLPGVFANNPMDGTINGSLWTLFYEVALYTSVLLAGVLGIIRRKKLIVVCVAALPVLYVITSNFDISDRVHTLSLLGVPFGTGVMAWIWRERIVVTFAWVALSWLAAWVLLGTAVSAPMLYFSVAVSVLYFAHVQKFPLKWPSKWGDLSYGIYIYAFPIQQTMVQFGPSYPAANIFLALPATLFMAWLSWNFLEKPALSFKKSRKTISQPVMRKDT